MGKIIVNNIRGMGWKTRIGLIAVFTLVFSVLIYQWHQSREANAAGVANGTVWSNIHAAAPATALPAGTNVNTTSTGTFTAGAGQSRLLLVAVYYELATASTATFTTTFGGAAVTQIASSGGVSNRQHVWLGYVKDASIPAAASTVVSGINCATTSSITSISIKVGTYIGVDQATPTSGTNGNATATTTAASTAVVNYVNGGKTIVATANGGAPATPAYTATPALTTNANATNTTNHSTYIAESAQHTANSSYASGGISVTYSGTTSARSAIAIGALRPATTNLGNGTAGTTGNVAPASTSQKIDGFAFNTTTAGSTDSITGLTVTSTGQAAIASMSIWNEAQTTQYFTTVNNPGSDTWTFSGGTPIPVTSTAANYKILVTYKNRASSPAGNTATTARVTAFTGTNLVSGSDTADTTLTLLNTHAASTWGANTAGDGQVTLNWSYGTPGQSVIIVRYTANSDTTKPNDGSTYGTGSPFGTGGTVVYNGSGTSYPNTGLTNGTTYYYKIFEFDQFNNYYTATDVWTAGLTPISQDAVAPTVDAGFAATTPVNTLAVPITSFSATDNVGGSGVSGYLITTSSTPPSSGAAGWTSTPPASYTVAGAGTYTLYPWAKDAGNNVSPLYGSPVTVVVDLTAPTISAFTATTPSASSSINITSFTAADAATSVNGYMITASSTPPAANDPAWSPTPIASYTVASDGTYTLYPWARDAAGNVSAVFGSPRTVVVDTTAPSGLAMVNPADEAVAQPQNTVLSCTTATDPSGGVMYQFEITDQNTYTVNSGWIAGTTYAPAGLVKGERYLWKVRAKDALGNDTGWLTQRTFTVTAPCVRNNPTLILLNSGGGIASTISTDGGTAPYNLRLINNDTGDCGSTTFNLSIADTDTYFAFDDSTFDNGLASKAIPLQPNSEITTPVTVRATPGHDSGVEKTTVTAAADANHAAITSGFVQTTLNVVTCQPKTPLLIVGPDSGYVNKAGKMVYTITVKNTDAGAGCSPVQFNLSKVSESNSTDFNSSQFSVPSLTLNAGELGSATLTVSAKSTAAKDAINQTVVALAATGHTSPANVTVTTTVNNPMLHNSDNTGSGKWSVSGGWGVPNGRYGEIDCNTCHVGGGGDTTNIKRINVAVFTPYTGAHNHFPGEGKPVAYRRYVGTSPTQPVLGWDGSATPRPAPTSTKICEACHTYDATGTNGVKAHPFATSATLGNHFNTDGTDCTKCHKHNKGFGASNMLCNTCHGDPSVTATIDATNRYVIAPPNNASGVAGVITGTGQVSNNPKVGAHQTHLQLLNGFTNYSTIDYRCEGCHGTLPSGPTWASHANGSSAPAFQGLATRGGMTPSFGSANLTCSNTYCHNPAASSIMKNAVNTGSNVFPTWTSAKYVGDTRKTQSNCGVCHKVPGDTGFEPAGTHSGMTIAATSCIGCHGHEGDNQGDVGKRHMDGILFGAGNCDTCHGYQAGSWAGATARAIEGKGAHEKHIAYLTSKYGVTLNPTVDQFGSAATTWTKVCGMCHATATHTMGEAIGGTGRSITFPSSLQFSGSVSVYNGIVGVSSGTTPKTCSNLSCHYKQTPIWSTY